jgi:glycine cleavage system H protein
MSGIPADLRYSDDHTWASGSAGGSRIRVGITDYAQESLGDIIALSTPALGANVQRGVACADVESTKSVSDIVSPVSGTVVAVNEDLEQAPEAINDDPYGGGWIFEVESTPELVSGDLSALKDAAAYAQLIGE